MAENSKIEWTDHTLNLWWGCAKVHTGCKNCYAEYLSETRYRNGVWGEDAPRKYIKSALNNLHKFQENAAQQNKVVRVFIGSMMDVFEDSKPLVYADGSDVPNDTMIHIMKTLQTEHLRYRLFKKIDEGRFPNIEFLFLTKRPGNINDMIPSKWKVNPPSNVWFGASVSDQNTLVEIMDEFQKVQGRLFLSVEPQVGRIDLSKWKNENNQGVHDHVAWIIVGGESGNKKRPYNTDWGREIRDYCQKHDVDFFFKQVDKVQEVPDDLMIRHFPYLSYVYQASVLQ